MGILVRLGDAMRDIDERIVAVPPASFLGVAGSD
jgi:hypothetical protein